jgi:hypothetical protein
MKFIARYFIVFDAIVNWIVSLIPFSVYALLVCRKGSNFCMLLLYPDILLKEFIYWQSFWGLFQGE